jgi:hypothetical protein
MNTKGDHIRCATTEDWEMGEILESSYCDVSGEILEKERDALFEYYLSAFFFLWLFRMALPF